MLISYEAVPEIKLYKTCHFSIQIHVQRNYQMGYIHVTNQINYNVHWDCLCYIYIRLEYNAY